MGGEGGQHAPARRVRGGAAQHQDGVRGTRRRPPRPGDHGVGRRTQLGRLGAGRYARTSVEQPGDVVLAGEQRAVEPGQRVRLRAGGGGLGPAAGAETTTEETPADTSAKVTASAR